MPGTSPRGATGAIPEQSTVVEELATNQAIAACASVCDAHHMIIGCDERSQKPANVAASTTSPWRHVGRTINGCTGTLIGDRWVPTAAHCLAGAGGNPIGFSLAQSSGATCPNGPSTPPWLKFRIHAAWSNLHVAGAWVELEGKYSPLCPILI